MATVGQIIHERREALGLTLDTLASAVGATKSYLSMIENHRVANPPSARLLAGLERALKIGDGELVRAADWQNTPPAIRTEMGRLAAAVRNGRELAALLKQTAQKKGGGRDLDALFKKGDLTQRVRELMRTDTDVPAEEIEKAKAAQKGKKAAGHAGKGGKAGKSGGGGVDPRVPVGFLVPLINRVAAGYPTEFTDLDYPARVADEYISCPGLADAQAFAARVVGESMLPEYRDGDVVIFSPAAKVADGSDCFVRFEVDHETTFKRVFFEEKGKKVRLQPLNPKFPAVTVEREQLAGLYRAVSRYAKL